MNIRPLQPAEDSAGLVCVNADDFVTGTHRAAANMLTMSPGAPWPHCSDVFAVP